MKSTRRLDEGDKSPFLLLFSSSLPVLLKNLFCSFHVLPCGHSPLFRPVNNDLHDIFASNFLHTSLSKPPTNNSIILKWKHTQTQTNTVHWQFFGDTVSRLFTIFFSLFIFIFWRTYCFNKYISTNIFLYPRFDDGTKRKEGESYWQFKEFMSVGFSYSF